MTEYGIYIVSQRVEGPSLLAWWHHRADSLLSTGPKPSLSVKGSPTDTTEREEDGDRRGTSREVGYGTDMGPETYLVSPSHRWTLDPVEPKPWFIVEDFRTKSQHLLRGSQSLTVLVPTRTRVKWTTQRRPLPPFSLPTKNGLQRVKKYKKNLGEETVDKGKPEEEERVSRPEKFWLFPLTRLLISFVWRLRVSSL